MPSSGLIILQYSYGAQSLDPKVPVYSFYKQNYVYISFPMSNGDDASSWTHLLTNRQYNGAQDSAIEVN